MIHIRITYNSIDSSPMKLSLHFLGFVLLLIGPAAFAAKDSLVTSVYSSVSNGYRREKLADGSFKREYYTIAKGIYSPGLTPNRSIDAVRFPQIAKLVAQFLALRNYYPVQDAKSADFALLITWGTTVPYDDTTRQTQANSFFAASNTLAAANAVVKESEDLHQQQVTTDGIQVPIRSTRDAARDAFEGQLLQLQMFNEARMSANERNAQLLGYVGEINRRNNPSQFAGAGEAFEDLMADLETERYYVIISAYDFRAATTQKPHKLLWSTRVSVQAQGNKFNETLAAMLARASRFFGQNSNRLFRQYQPETRVDLGELQILGVVPQPEPGENPSRVTPK
jgi:hypothetical protein